MIELLCHVGLEDKSSFLDHKITEFAWSLPRNFRIHNNNGKKILREILYKYVPKNLVDRPKQGFGMPVNEWLRGPLKNGLMIYSLKANFQRWFFKW